MIKYARVSIISKPLQTPYISSHLNMYVHAYMYVYNVVFLYAYIL